MNVTTPNVVEELNKLLTEQFGEKTKGLIARAPMWGHEDNCWIIYGPRAQEAGKVLSKRFNAKLTVKSSNILMGTTATIEWKAA